MSELTEKELNRAFDIWNYNYPTKETDKLLIPFLTSSIKSLSYWLEDTRRGLFLSTQTIAKKLNVHQATYSKYEKREREGNITIKTLKLAAEAMDCELIYAIRPKQQKTCSRMTWGQVLPMARKHPWLQKCYAPRRGEALAAIAIRLAKNPTFRKSQAWTQEQNLDLWP